MKWFVFYTQHSGCIVGRTPEYHQIFDTKEEAKAFIDQFDSQNGQPSILGSGWKDYRELQYVIHGEKILPEFESVEVTTSSTILKRSFK